MHNLCNFDFQNHCFSVKLFCIFLDKTANLCCKITIFHVYLFEKKTMVLHRVEMGKGYKMITVSLEEQAKL